MSSEIGTASVATTYIMYNAYDMNSMLYCSVCVCVCVCACVCVCVCVCNCLLITSDVGHITV